MTTNWRRISYEGMLAETVMFPSQNGDIIGGYLARPLGNGPFPGVIVIHEAFGLVNWTKELARKFAAHGYSALAPDLLSRQGGLDPSDVHTVMQLMRSLPDSQVIADLEGAARALRSIPTANDKVGCIGHCSGGRQTVLFACNTKNLNAAVDCYGGRVVTTESTPGQPKPVIDMIADLSCPLLGLFGQADTNPSHEHVARLEEELKKHGKVYELKSYPPDTGHGFFADYRASYRQESAVDGWEKIFDFFGRYLS